MFCMQLLLLLLNKFVRNKWNMGASVMDDAYGKYRVSLLSWWFLRRFGSVGIVTDRSTASTTDVAVSGASLLRLRRIEFDILCNECSLSRESFERESPTTECMYEVSILERNGHQELVLLPRSWITSLETVVPLVVNNRDVLKSDGIGKFWYDYFRRFRPTSLFCLILFCPECLCRALSLK